MDFEKIPYFLELTLNTQELHLRNLTNALNVRENVENLMEEVEVDPQSSNNELKIIKELSLLQNMLNILKVRGI